MPALNVINTMDAHDNNLYFNYRIVLKAKSEGHLDKISIDNSENENNEFYKRFKNEAEKEINLLNKFGIKPVKTNRLINGCEKKSVSPALPQFLHIYDPLNIFTKIKPAKGIFLTSSRYKNAKIYKPENNTLKDFEGSYRNFDFICIGTSSEAEIDFLKKFSGNSNSLLLILPAHSLTNLDFINRLEPGGRFNFKNSLLISALDPFSKISKYGFALRNSLAFHLSQEMAVLYLSEKSSLSSVIKKFETAGKPVKIFEREYIAKPYKKPNANSIGIKKEHDSIQKFIINSLEKENITIDNLLKLSNIKFNANNKEIIKAISILEMNSEIERCPGGIIKKL
ncbi:MAG: hypothetical protein ACYDDB_06010 [bacterium]